MKPRIRKSKNIERQIQSNIRSVSNNIKPKVQKQNPKITTERYQFPQSHRQIFYTKNSISPKITNIRTQSSNPQKANQKFMNSKTNNQIQTQKTKNIPRRYNYESKNTRRQQISDRNIQIRSNNTQSNKIHFRQDNRIQNVSKGLGKNNRKKLPGNIKQSKPYHRRVVSDIDQISKNIRFQKKVNVEYGLQKSGVRVVSIGSKRMSRNNNRFN